jgi:hypothetical protein
MKAVMELKIQKESLADDVKRTFTGHYPFLKIELYKMPVSGNLTTTKKEMLPSNLPLDLFTNATDKTIDINDYITVAELENQFALIGLTAEVFRKSGNVWVETTLTSNWTLQQQNAEGEEISGHFNTNKISLI